MKKTVEVNNQEIVDVVDEFDYSTQQESYNKRFIEWRRNKKNLYAFNFIGNSKESVFVDGQGFIEHSPADAEKSVLNKILYVLGIAFLVFVIIEDVLDRLIVQILDMLGMNIHNSFANFVVYGGKTEITVLLVVFTLLKLLVPLIIMHSKFKMPIRLSCPFSLNNSGELLGAISAALVVGVVTGLPAAYSSKTKELYNMFRTYDADISAWGQEEFLIYTIFDIIIVSVLFEMVFRGELFQVLRQFGDVYAIIITSVISGLVTQNFRVMIATMLISVVSAIGMLRSGTILTAIFVRIAYKLYIFALDIIEMNDSDNMIIQRGIFMAGVFAASLLVLSIIFLNKEKRERTSFARYGEYLSLKKKLILSIETIPLTAAAAACVLAAALK